MAPAKLKITRLEAFRVPVALKSPVRHASFTRTHNDTLIVRCELADGSVGWGEGLPRTYVTGESIQSVWRHLEATDFQPLSARGLSTPEDVVRLLDDFQLAEVAADEGVTPRECFGNAVRCGLELSLLDAAGHSWQSSVGELIARLPQSQGLIERRSHVRYSGVATASTGRRQWRTALKMRLYGFRQVKVKVGTDGVDDVAFCRRLRSVVGPRVDLRLDVNEAWSPEDVVERLHGLSKFHITSVEQPVPHRYVDRLAEIRPQTSVPIMLDESLCCMEDAQRAIVAGSCDLFNLRISKCGGLVACLRLAALAREHHLGFQLGCQVGETGILSAAGRQLACTIGGLRYLEGSYDGFLVKERLTRQNLTIRYGGRAPQLTGCGLGVTVDERRVRQLAEGRLRLI